MKGKKFAFYLTEKQHQALKVAAASHDPPLTMNDYILIVLFGSPAREQIATRPTEVARKPERIGG